MSPNMWLQIFPYTSAVAALLGQTFDIKQLKTYEGVAPLKDRLVAFIIELVTVVMVCALSADAGMKAGVVRGAIVGGASAIVAYVLPRMYLAPVVSRLCKSCNHWGKLSLGICVLLGTFALMVAFNWVMTR